MTLKELAERLNLSTTTVSRVLTGQQEKYRISEKTAERVRKMAVQHDFAPNQVARNLRLRTTNTIGLIIPDISNPFFANLARTVEQELRDRGKMVLLCDTKDDTDLEKESIELLLSRKVDGMLIAPVGEQWGHFKKNTRVPIVLIDRYSETEGLPYISTDNHLGAYMATEYLISKGHSDIACIQGLIHSSPNIDRVRGYREALENSDLPVRKDFLPGGDYSIENGYRSTSSLLNKDKRPSAIFALNNQIALGSMKAIKEFGLSIPEDISLIAFDEQYYFELLSPPLSSISQPMKEIGKTAVQALQELLDGKNTSNQKLKPRLIERESVKDIRRL